MIGNYMSSESPLKSLPLSTIRAQPVILFNAKNYRNSGNEAVSSIYILAFVCVFSCAVPSIVPVKRSSLIQSETVFCIPCANLCPLGFRHERSPRYALFLALMLTGAASLAPLPRRTSHAALQSNLLGRSWRCSITATCGGRRRSQAIRRGSESLIKTRTTFASWCMASSTPPSTDSVSDAPRKPPRQYRN